MTPATLVDLSGRHACIIGCPNTLVTRIKAAAARGGAQLHLVLAAIGLQGYFGLVPHDSHACAELNFYLNQIPSYNDAVVVVLPYCPLPVALKADLTALEECGGAVIRVTAGSASFPKATGKLDAVFVEQVAMSLLASLFPSGVPKELTPSEHFRAIAQRLPRLHIPNKALDECDQVAVHRFKFMRSAGDAIETFLTVGAGGRIDAFFAGRGLGHAQSGGLLATLKIYREKRCLLHESVSTHLKQGDKTTPKAAARIYYHHYEIDNSACVAILYAGPHPNESVKELMRELFLDPPGAPGQTA